MKKSVWYRIAIIAILVVLTPPALIAIGELVGRLSGGRLGLIPVQGMSMGLIYPPGCDVICNPWTELKEGGPVVAYGNLESEEDRADIEPALMVKIYMGDHLVSLCSSDTSSSFSVRSIIVGSIPANAVFFWRDSGANDGVLSAPTPERVAQARLHESREALKAKEARQKFEGDGGLFVPGIPMDLQDFFEHIPPSVSEGAAVAYFFGCEVQVTSVDVEACEIPPSDGVAIIEVLSGGEWVPFSTPCAVTGIKITARNGPISYSKIRVYGR